MSPFVPPSESPLSKRIVFFMSCPGQTSGRPCSWWLLLPISNHRVGLLLAFLLSEQSSVCLHLCLCTCPPLMSQVQHANIFLPTTTGITFEHLPTFSYLDFRHRFLFIPKVVCFILLFAFLCVWLCDIYIYVCIYLFFMYSLCVFICVLFIYVTCIWMCIYMFCVWYVHVCICVDIY